MADPKGAPRIKNSDPIPDGVWVADGGQGFEISETNYVAKGYSPPLETLGWGKSVPGSDDA